MWKVDGPVLLLRPLRFGANVVHSIHCPFGGLPVPAGHRGVPGAQGCSAFEPVQWPDSTLSSQLASATWLMASSRLWVPAGGKSYQV